jgi:hypothetical protein
LINRSVERKAKENPFYLKIDVMDTTIFEELEEIRRGIMVLKE